MAETTGQPELHIVIPAGTDRHEAFYKILWLVGGGRKAIPVGPVAEEDSLPVRFEPPIDKPGADRLVGELTALGYKGSQVELRHFSRPKVVPIDTDEVALYEDRLD